MVNKLYVMIGIPGSGKSYCAKKLVEEGKVDKLFSSDEYREKLLGDINNQEDNVFVFTSLYKDLVRALKDGYNCVLDCTNINRKSRAKLFNCLKQNNVDIPVTAILIACSENIARERNNNRGRKVPDNVISSFISRFEMPMLGEGFTDIEYITYCNEYTDISEELNKTRGFDQLNPHHTSDLFHHMARCFNYVAHRTTNKELLVASLIHDIGKVYTQTVDDLGIGHYFRHENIGGYMSMFMKENFFSDPVDMYKVAFYINYHMEPYRLAKAKESTLNKYKDMFGSEWDNICLLHEADENAH